ncbi:tellurite resistance/C4-dicarboxylate transporter family protein [Olivibacter sp. SDN3]|uniref:tellurite resistance/C4-dicarboxylate transporter family protein n=1 Tax=Olivibacter sp. SDN3 TaxID=2764720 RepID=UPI0016510501|nr:tellurite resistance/C4-dicarboxylate transporter family protein [Olivibacter sp. SDN3]QNL47989.1 tellurite resistance/C4-dicarboxylate transporter family protein [Olivibacter sp. SDN3]
MSLLQQRVKVLLPAYFAMVMATGIVSIACLLVGFTWTAAVLFYLNIIFLIGLSTLFFYRIICYRSEVVNDFKSYQKGPGFFTIVAALCIVGNQVMLFYQWLVFATAILILAAILWVIIIYGFFFNITTTDDKKPLKEGINGTWLVIIVSIQALSILINFVSEVFGEQTHIFLFIALCLFLLGCFFYLYIISLIIYRISFFSLNATELGAPYWINMGATAISTLAGSMLILRAQAFNFLDEILPFLKGFTLFFWASGSWWIPLLVLLGIWRHVIKKVPVPTSAKGYDPSYWAMVFPLGMYTVCTFRLSEALHIPFLKTIPDYFVYIGIFAWLAVMIGFIKQMIFVFGGKTEIAN